MDHLIPTRDPQLKVTSHGLTLDADPLRDSQYIIKIPYLARDEFLWHSSGPDDVCLTHGERTGWEDRLRTGDFGSFGPDDAVSFLQSWLFFSMMEEVLETRIRLQDFITVNDGEEYVTTLRLSNILNDWGHRLKSQSDTQKERSRRSISHSFLGWKIAVRRMFPVDAQAWYQNDTRAEAILLSIGVLGESLRWASMNILDNVQPGQTVRIENSFRLLDDVAGPTFLYQRMTDEGWCPSEIVYLWKTFGLSGMYSAYTIGPPNPSTNHQARGCLKRQCKALQLDEATYRTKHVRADCHCTLFELQAEELSAILRNGQTPVLSMKLMGSDIEPEMTSCESTDPYVAISHVWFDGLGNPRSNAIHMCQLRKLRDDFLATFWENASEKKFEGRYIRATLVDMYSEGQQRHFSGFSSSVSSNRVSFWIDTLCVPQIQEQPRKLAISRMRQYYENALFVWVLDASVMRLSSEDDPEKILLRIASAPWTRRLWTYQEAQLAKKLIYQLSDLGVVVTDVWNDWWTSGTDIFNSLPILLPMMVPGFFSLRQISVPQINILEHFRWRSTSKLRDEPSCIATLLQLDVSRILNVSEDQRMIELVRQQPSWPVDILFWRTDRICRVPNFAWCPKSFLAMPPSVEYWKSKIDYTATGTYTVFHEDDSGSVGGFVVNLPGFVLPKELNMDEGDGELPYVFRQADTGEIWSYSLDDIAGNCGVPQAETKLAIIMRGEEQFAEAWPGILVTCWMQDKDGLLFADYISRVIVRRVDKEEISSNTMIEEAEWKPRTQRWCIGSSPPDE